MTERIEIDSVAEYVNQISILEDASKQDEFSRKNKYMFRGHAAETWELLPSLARHVGCPYNNLFDVERNLIEMAKFKVPDMFSDSLSPVELLALLQHYGLPTRLLDVSENALVALFFTCKGEFERNGEVVVFLSRERDVANYPVYNAIAETYLLAIGNGYPLEDFYESAKKRPYFNEQDRITRNKSKEDGGKWIKECIENPIFIYASLRSARQWIQSGRYILFPNEVCRASKNKYWFNSKIMPIPREHECIRKFFVIDKNNKKRILNELMLLGITESNLFPDDISKVCADISKQYR